MTLTINDLRVSGDDQPRVEVLLTGLASTVKTVTVFRLAGGSEIPVQGIIDVPVAGAGAWVDWEVPAQQATYRAHLFGDGGVDLGFSNPVVVELGFAGCWMHNPLAPSGAVRVDLAGSSAQSLSRPVPGQTVFPRGRRVGVMVTAPRRGLAGVVFDVSSHDLQTADKIQAFLGGDAAIMTPVICIRMGVDHSGVRVASPLFLGVLDIAEQGQDVSWGGSWTMQRIQGDEAAPPARGLFVPLLRRKDLNAFYASRAELNSAYLTRLAAARDYSLGGFGG